MYKVTLLAGKERENILGLQFKEGVAMVPDDLKDKAFAVKRNYNVSVEYIDESQVQDGIEGTDTDGNEFDDDDDNDAE